MRGTQDVDLQIEALPGTHAFRVMTLRDITEGESLTTSYTNKGYYEGPSQCRCATCNPAVPPIAPRRPPEETPPQPAPEEKRTRNRATLKRRRQKQQAKDERSMAAAVEAVPDATQ